MYIFLFLRKTAFILIIALLIVMSSITGFVKLPNSVYFGALIIFGITFFKSKNIHIGLSAIIFFILACLMSLLLNVYPEYFRVWDRFLVYLLVLLLVSPIFINNVINELRLKLFISIIVLCILLSIASFFAYFLGINYFIVNEEVLDIQAGWFSGFMNHSMVLGPVSAISAIVTFSCFLSATSKKLKIFLFLALLCCYGSTLLAASRIALGGGTLGMIVVLANHYRDQFLRFIRTIGIVFLLSITTFPLWSNLTDFVVAKQNANIETGGTFSSRDTKLEARISEFNSSPLFGIGFCTINPTLDKVNIQSGQIEPGSSWLAIASMTGLLGFFTFIVVYIKAYYKALKFKNPLLSNIFCGLLSFYFIHMTVEGYIMAPGSFLTFMFWLLIGSIWVTNEVLYKSLSLK